METPKRHDPKYYSHTTVFLDSKHQNTGLCIEFNYEPTKGPRIVFGVRKERPESKEAISPTIRTAFLSLFPNCYDKANNSNYSNNEKMKISHWDSWVFLYPFSGPASSMRTGTRIVLTSANISGYSGFGKFAIDEAVQKVVADAVTKIIEDTNRTAT